MPTWRCPFCSTPQELSSRCWVCHRSSTSCATCRHFRGSVAARMGFCGLDRRREPLAGPEVRACWEDGAVALPPEPSAPGLLDLLTVHALGEPAVADPEREPELGAPPSAEERPARPVPRLRSMSPTRDWVEVDLQPVEA